MILPLLAGLFLTATDVGGAFVPSPALPSLLVALEVNERGRASGCRIVTSSGYAPFDEHACGLMLRRYKVSPRLINSVPASYTTTISLHWSGEEGLAQ